MSAGQGTVTAESSRSFETIDCGLGVGNPAPSGWQHIADCRLVIIVGVTGVGKSTMLYWLGRMDKAFTYLPDRRLLTDRLIIAQMQIADGLPIRQVRDRRERFRLTRRYRARHPGGMAQALATLWLDPSVAPSPLVFDGLRGANEVAHAATALPKARFVVLDAPDWERLKRLLGRNDDFDHIAARRTSVTSIEVDTCALDVPGAESLFSTTEMKTMLHWVQAGTVSFADLRAKLSIAVEERRNYDPGAALAVLRDVAWNRTLYIDTVTHSPEESAEAVASWLGGQVGYGVGS